MVQLQNRYGKWDKKDKTSTPVRLRFRIEAVFRESGHYIGVDHTMSYVLNGEPFFRVVDEKSTDGD